jgi:hypothetical protein
MATLANVESSLAQTIKWVQDESVRRGARQRFWVTTGYRPYDEQVSIFLDRNTTTVLPGRPTAVWNNKRYYLKPGQSLAAVPGTSDHGKSPATAVDLACQTADSCLRIELVKAAQLTTPVAGEPWHMKLRAGAAIPITQKEAVMSDSPYITIPCPTGGFWRLQKANGGVGAEGGAPFFGALPGANAKVVSPIVGLTPCMRGGVIIGYWIYTNDGRLYNFGQAPYFTSYFDHPEWHSPNSLIDGLVQTAGFAAGTQIRYAFLRYELGDAEYIPDTYDIGKEFAK